MGNDRTTVRHALDRAHRLLAGLVPSGRGPLAFGIAATVFLSALGPPRINGVRHFESAGREFYCASVENIGERPSSPARLVFRARGVPGSGPVVPALEPNQISEHCILRSELPAEQHQLEITVDEPRQISEINEANNRYEMTIPALAPASAAPGLVPSPQPKPNGPQPEPSGDQAGLAVRGIWVNGQAPNGKDDCKDGKNAVTVVVKNAGTAKAWGRRALWTV